MTEKVEKYQIYCETEAQWKYTWGTTPPTTCPTNTAHTVNLNSVAIVDSVSDTDVTIKGPTDGRFMVECFEANIPAGNPGDVTVHDFPFNEEFLMWTVDFNAVDNMLGDRFDMIIGPDTPVGTTTAIANSGSTTFQVNTTVLDNIIPGTYAKIMDPTTTPPTIEDLGKCKSVDKGNFTITMYNSTTKSFPVGSVILMNIYMGKNIILDRPDHYSFTQKGFQGKLIPENTTFRMFYTNSDGSAKTFVWRVGYYYGGTVYYNL